MSDIPRPTPHEAGEADPKDPSEPQDDVDVTVAWCDVCDAERTFEKRQVDVSEAEAASAEPDVGQALYGETAWVCGECGDVRRDLVEDEGYEYLFSDVGYHVDQFPDDEETVRSESEEGVSPPERVASARTEQELEDLRKDEEEERPTGGPANR